MSPTAEDMLRAELEAKAATENGTYVPSSEGYIQRYDCRGHPQNLASEYLREQSRRAQNSVSSLLNDYRDKIAQQHENSNNKLPIDPAELQTVRSENEIGLLILAGDQDLSLSTSLCLVGVRQRLQVSRFSANSGRLTNHCTQTFHLYTGASLWEVLKFEWIHFGLKKMLFAGFPASCLNRTGNSIPHRVSDFCDFLAQLVVLGPFRVRKQGEHVTGVSATSKQMYSCRTNH